MDGRIAIDVQFVVPGRPKAWERAGRDSRQASGGHYYVRDSVTIEAHAFATFAKLALRGKPPHRGPVLLGVKSVFPVPQTWPMWKRNLALSGQIRPIAKPDIDNLTKLVMDALNGICWIDDAQVVGALPGAGKWYGLEAQTEIRIAFLPHIETETQARALLGSETPSATTRARA
jgi:Holliday junction resolvase RusA-like endonuclease